jgi:hypothetical protein
MTLILTTLSITPKNCGIQPRRHLASNVVMPSVPFFIVMLSVVSLIVVIVSVVAPKTESFFNIHSILFSGGLVCFLDGCYGSHHPGVNAIKLFYFILDK